MSTRTAPGRRAFTLIEIMVAMVIFSLVMASLFASFRAAVKSYDLGITRSEGDQGMRFAISQVTDDLRNVFYRNPNSYNVNRRQREQMAAARDAKLLKSGAAGRQAEDPALPDLGPPIDLTFRSSDGGDNDQISFVRQQTMKHGEDRKPWGLGRVGYLIKDNALYRTLDDVMAPETDEYGNEIPKETRPAEEKIATNVKAVDFKFGYWHDGEWLTAPDWDSNAPRYRNPYEEDPDKDKAQGQGQPELPADQAALIQQQEQAQRADDLPAWVEITFTFLDPNRPESERKLRQVVQMTAAQETYVPPEVLETRSRRGRFMSDRGDTGGFAGRRRGGGSGGTDQGDRGRTRQ